MNVFVRRLWTDASRAARAGLAIGLLLIAGLGSAALFTVLRTDYQPLFAELEPQDAAGITAELDRMKLPYRLSRDGGTILVEREQVHPTRLKLMAKGVPLHGGVGLEIFSSNDFGMTEFAQKVNYQRALQGELTRTIAALEEVRQVRVHLVLPEAGLFRKAGAKPKAAVTLAMKRGRRLEAQQVLGIQRLIAAAVPDIDAAGVTIVDEQGHALTRPADVDNSVGVEARLSAKSEVEQQVARKVVAVLDKAFGPGRAIVTVDATLNHDQVRVTREDVIPATGRGAEASGALTRKRTSATGAAAAGDAAAAGAAGLDDVARGAGSSAEYEYQNGRRVEQVVSQPGAVRQLSVAVLLPVALDKAQLDELRQLIGASAGLNTGRGDELAISSLQQFGAAPAAAASQAPADEAPPDAAAAAAAEPRQLSLPALGWWLSGTLLVLLLALAVVLSRRRPAAAPAPVAALSDEARERMLRQLRVWLAEERSA